IESPTGIDQRVDAGRVEDRRAQAAQLRLEIRVAHRPLETADRMLYALLDDRAVGEPDSHVRRVLSEFRVDARNDAGAPRNGARGVAPLGGELRVAQRAVDDGDGRAMVDADLALESHLRRRLAGQLEHQWMNLGLDARDAPRHEPMPIAQLDAGVDRWM